MARNPVTLTLDANVLIDGADGPPERRELYRGLEQLAAIGAVQFAYTSRIVADKMSDPDDARRDRDLKKAREAVSIPTTLRCDVGTLDDIIADDDLLGKLHDLFGVKFPLTGRPNSVYDVDHLYGHLVAGREFFATSDREVLGARRELRALGIIVVSADQLFTALTEAAIAVVPEEISDRLRAVLLALS